MYQRNYYITKSSNTFSDTLATYGLAGILTNILGDAKDRGLYSGTLRVWLIDKGQYYEIQLPTELCLNR